MRCSHRLAISCGAVGVLVTSAILGARLNSWAENTVAGSRVERALFRPMQLPSGAVLARRPPVESVQELSEAIRQSPSQSDLYALRAQEEERQIAIAPAENDWLKAAALAPDKAAALMDLADFYHRRVEPSKEIATLMNAGKLASSGMDRFRPESSQAAWHAFDRATNVSREARLGPASLDGIYQGWIDRYGSNREPYLRYMDALAAAKDRGRAQILQNRIASQFRNDAQLLVQTEAKLAGIGGGPNAELKVYADRFSPLWPTELRTRYYQLLTNAHQLRSFLASARAESAASPTALQPVLKIYFYYEQDAKRDAADEELLAWKSRRSVGHSSIDVKEQLTAGPLFERVGDYDEAARSFYEVYESSMAAPDEKEEALSALISVLLDVPEQPLRLGQRDLSLYRNSAKMDPHPGFLNGILSLALNTTFPQYEYQAASQAAATYFHRAAAARFLERMEQQFPGTSRATALQAKLFAAYAVYGQSEVLVRLVPAWLLRNGGSPEYVETALLLADAYSNTSRSAQEFAIYDKLLVELAEKSEHVPLGPEMVSGDSHRSPLARSADYARVLDRYISRLTQEKRVTDAIALYKKEIDRNPDDPGLYQRLALYIEQNRLDAQLADTYRAAFDRFKDRSWADKLGRFYLRRKQTAAYQLLTRQVTDTFAGSELAGYIANVAPDPKINPVLYRQVNLYAHQRFPHNLTFVRGLLAAYRAKGTADAVAYEKLLRENWFYDSGLRSTFFEYLSRSGTLQSELASLPTAEAAWQQKNVAALQMRAEGLAWLTDFEGAVAAFAGLARAVPGDQTSNARAISIERSLTPSVRGAFEQAVQFGEQDLRAAPRNREAFIRLGEIYADRQLFEKAAPAWNHVAAIEPGSTAGYLQAATVFWDYFQYDDALRLINEARHSLNQPARFAYEAGAIWENKGDFVRAISEYAKGALEEPPSGENGAAENRLITLARRKDTGNLVERDTAALIGNTFNGDALRLRVAILESQNRRTEIGALLSSEINKATQVSDADQVKQVADRFGFYDTSTAALARMVDLTNDPVEKIKARVDLATFREDHGDAAGAEREFSSLLSANPNLMGVVRADADFYWREKQYAKTVSTLSAAASRAQQPFKTELLREAAQKASDSQEFEVARQLLDRLLADDAYNGDLLAQKAATYARANDSKGLADFYSGELALLNAAPLPQAEKTDRLAALRRGYIPALIATDQFSEALEQYEQVLNSFPEDESLAEEAARFAERHQLKDRLISHYSKAAADSPRNYRWPLLLARLDNAFRDYSEAIAAYGKAAYIRPDRTDILVAKGDLENRIQRFDDALKTNQKLYELSYHDTRYLIEQATLQARLSNTPEAVRLLRAAYIDAHPNEPAGYVAAMRQMTMWHMFGEATNLFKEARPLLNEGDESAADAVSLAAQSLVSLHRPADAMSTVTEAWRNIKGLSNDGRAKRYSTTIGQTAREYLTTAEKSAFAKTISPPGNLPAPFDRYQLANSAGLFDIAAEALSKKLRHKPGYEWNSLQQLQSARLAYDLLGRQLEALAGSVTDEAERTQILQASVDAYAKAGDGAAQLRLADSSGVNNLLGPQKYAQLFVAQQDFSAKLSILAKRNPKYANAVVQYVLSRQAAPETVKVIQARGAALPSPWVQTYTALSGLYFLSPDPAVARCFDSILGPRTVGAELADLRTPDGGVLRDKTWFYYAARYADYLSYRKESDGDLLPASLENAPASSNSYVTLGDTFRDLGRLPNALALYQQALQISPERADLYDRMAVTQAGAGQKQQALANWRQAFQLLAARVEQGPLPADYWQTAQRTLQHTNEYHVADELRPDIDALLRSYVKRNAGYNFTPLAQGLLENAPDQARALSEILDIARRADIRPMLNQLIEAEWLGDAQKNAIYLFSIERGKAEIISSAGDARNAAREELQQLEANYTRYLLSQGRAKEAWEAIQQIQPPDKRPPDLVLRAAALTGNLDQQLSAYRSQPETTPSGEQILSAAAALASDHHEDSALVLEEFEYQRELDGGGAPASAYFGLAQVRITQKRLPEAEELTKTVTVSVGAPFANLPEAVQLFEKAGLAAIAAKYAGQWKSAEPWNGDAQLSFARLSNGVAALEGIRTSTGTPYVARARAAIALRDLSRSASGTDELSLLTHKVISAAEASQPFFVWARLLAAGTAADNGDRVKLLRQAISLEPTIRKQRVDLAAAAFRAGQKALGLAALDSYTAASYVPDVSTGVVELDSRENLQQTQETAARVLTDERDFERAGSLYDQILTSLAEGADRLRITKLRDAARQQSKLAGLNAARQPVVTEQLTQPGIVKPKLSAIPAQWSDE